MEIERLSGGAAAGRGNSTSEQVLRATWRCATLVILLLCAMLVARRAAGELRQPLPGAALIGLAFVVESIATVLRAARPMAGPLSPDWLGLLERGAAPGLCVVLFGIAVSLPGTAPWGLAGFWTLLAIGEIAWCWRSVPVYLPRLRDRWPARRSAATESRLAAFQRLDQGGADMIELRDEEDESSDTSLPAEVTQQLTRSKSGHDGELVVGMVRADFALGERSQNLHLAFCPPFDGIPVLSAEQVEGPGVAVKVAEVECYGARLELKLNSRCDANASVIVRFEAMWSASADPATDASHGN